MPKQTVSKDFLFKLVCAAIFFGTGAYIFSPFVDYQMALSNGDHGLILYASEAVSRGDQPYHDFHYFYGPLMPYYYSLFFKIFGTNIPSILMGKLLLDILNGALIFLTLRMFIPSPLSWVAAIWFWVNQVEFFYTYNHVGITTTSLAILYCLALYIRSQRMKFLYYGLLLVVIASFIKLNFGFCALAGLILSVPFIDYFKRVDLLSSNKKLFYITAIFILPALIILGNWLTVWGLPFYVIKQCFQYFGNDAPAAYYPSIIDNIKNLGSSLIYLILSKWHSQFFCIIIFALALSNIHYIKQKKSTNDRFKDMFLLAGALILFMILYLHEYIISGIVFRSFYSIPFIFIFLFLIIGLFMHNTARYVRIAVSSVILFIALFQFSLRLDHIKMFLHPWHYLPQKNAKIFVGNSPRWVLTVHQTLDYLEKHLTKSELFFALPYDPLYYFLADKRSPTRQLVFFHFTGIPEKQEREIINELENQHINWIVVTNRIISSDPGLGTFGVTHCQLLNQYINNHFEIQAQFGDWDIEPGWIGPHGVRILKRISD